MATWSPLVSMAGVVYRPGSLTHQSLLAGLAQNPFKTVITGTTAIAAGLTLKREQLIGRFSFRGLALKGSEVRESPAGSNVGWGLGTGQCGLCLLRST